MSVFFGIVLETETWMQSSSDNRSSKNIPYVYKTLDRIAANKGLKTLSHFVVEDKEYYQKTLEDTRRYWQEALETTEGFDPDEYLLALQQKIEELADKPDWFSPEEASQAIKTMQGLIEHLRCHPDLFCEYGVAANEVISKELEGFARFLNEVQSRNIRFKFYME